MNNDTGSSPVFCFSLKSNIKNVSKNLNFNTEKLDTMNAKNSKPNQKINTHNRNNSSSCLWNSYNCRHSRGSYNLTKVSRTDKIVKQLEIKSTVQNLVQKNFENYGYNKILGSSLSSNCSPTSRVKRKLDFDEDVDYNQVRKKICPSLPVENVVFSPETRRLLLRDVASERPASSSTSSKSVRRNLFGTYSKNFNQSPVLGNNNSKFSLNKKLPNVTSNNSRRTNLLLNLAISKYNVSSHEAKSNNSGTNKSERIFPVSSPVFLKQRRIKRKLNFEENENLISSSVGSSSVGNSYIFNASDCNNAKTKTFKFNVGISPELKSYQRDNSKNPEVTLERKNVDKLFTKYEERRTDSVSPILSFKQKLAFKSQSLVNLPNRQNSLMAINQLTSPIIKSKSSNAPLTSDVSKLVQNSKLRSSMRSVIQSLTEIPGAQNSSSSLILDSQNFAVGSSPILNNSILPIKNNVECTSSLIDENNIPSPILDSQINSNFKTHSNLTNEKLNDSDVSDNSGSVIFSSTNQKTEKRTKTFTNIYQKLKDEKNTDSQLEQKDKNQETKNNHIERFLDDCVTITQESFQSIDDDNVKNLGQCDPSSKIVDNLSSTNNVAKNLEQNSLKFPDFENEIINHIVVYATPSKEHSESNEELQKNPLNIISTVTIETISSEKENLKKCINDDVYENAKQNTLHEEICIIDDYSESDESDGEKGLENRFEKIYEKTDNKLQIISASSTSNDASCEIKTPKKTEFEEEQAMKTFDSNIKGRRKKHKPNSLTARMINVVNRMKSSVRLWQYELSKSKKHKNSPCEEIHHDIPGVFFICEMWKESFHLILKCKPAFEDKTDTNYDDFVSGNLCSETIADYMYIMLSKEHISLPLKCCNLIRIYPPWKLLYLNEYRVHLMLNVHMIQVLCPDEKIRNENSLIVREDFNTCSKVKKKNWNSIVPKEYTNIMEPLLDFNRCDIKNENENLKTYTADMLSNLKNTIYETVNWKVLCPINCSQISLKILSAHRVDMKMHRNVWFFVGHDMTNEICCIIAKDADKWNDMLKIISGGRSYNFNGVIPWKRISWKNNTEIMNWLSSLGCNVKCVQEFQNYDKNFSYLFLLSEYCGFVVHSFL